MTLMTASNGLIWCRQLGRRENLLVHISSASFRKVDFIKYKVSLDGNLLVFLNLAELDCSVDDKLATIKSPRHILTEQLDFCVSFLIQINA